MPPVIAILAAGATLYAGARWARRELLELEKRQRQADLSRRGSAARSVGKLSQDPESGVYRPK